MLLLVTVTPVNRAAITGGAGMQATDWVPKAGVQQPGLFRQSLAITCARTNKWASGNWHSALLVSETGILMSTTDPPVFLIPNLPMNYVLVLGIGNYTINFLWFEFRSGQKPHLVPDWFGTIENGVSIVQQRMADAYQEMTEVPLPAKMTSNTWQYKQMQVIGYALSKAIELMKLWLLG